MVHPSDLVACVAPSLTSVALACPFPPVSAYTYPVKQSFRPPGRSLSEGGDHSREIASTRVCADLLRYFDQATRA